MHVLKQQVPAGMDTHEEVDRTAQYIAEELSRNCSDTDDPREFYYEVSFKKSLSPSGQTLWLVGSLDREPTQHNYGDGGDFPTALDREPVDLTPEEYSVHMDEKVNS